MTQLLQSEARERLRQMAAWIAGEVHADHPACVSPVIGGFLRTWNDQLPTDADRDRLLKPLLAEVIGTNLGAAEENTRVWLATDWAVRESAPAWLELAGLAADAAALRALAPLTDAAAARLAEPALAAARKNATVAEAAAEVDAWVATEPIARAALMAAAGGATGGAAWAAACAACAAAWAAADKALAATVEVLQASAAKLVLRMCQVGR